MPVRSATMTHDLRTIQASLRQLLHAFERLSATLAKTDATGARPRRKLRLTPARRAALKLQGQYMGYMRSLTPTQKAKVKRIRAAKGVRAAIAAARRLTKT